MACANTPNTIVWEFQSDLPGMFAPYSDKISNHIEDKYAQNPTANVELKVVEPVLKDFSVDLGNMVQISSTNGSQRQVRRQLYDVNSTIGTGIVWEWLTDMGWITYDVDTLNAIEDAFTKNEEELDLTPLKYNLPNVVLIDKGYQKNKSSNFVRPIQRKAVTYKSTVTNTQNIVKPARKRANQVAAVKPPLPSTSGSPSKLSTQPQGASYSPQHQGTSYSAGVTGKQRYHPIPRNPKKAASSPVKSAAVPMSPKTKNADVMKFCNQATQVKDGEECAICLIPLKDDSDDDDDNDDNNMLMHENIIVELKKCKHRYHLSCMEAYCNQGQKDGCIQCPICKTIHGIKMGNQPPGTMNVSIDQNKSVSGYEGEGMITITYDIHSGMQGPNGPDPRSRFNAIGFPRTAYLPANAKGKKVLKLLKLAWERRLIFTIGTSTTTGRDNSVVWNEIHHKTSPRDDGSGHGYPDPKYLDNVIEELKQHGIVDDDVS